MSSRGDGSGQAGETGGQPCETCENGISIDCVNGCGVIAIPEDSFASAEAGVIANMGRGSAAVGAVAGAAVAGQASAPEDISSVPDADENMGDDAFEGINADELGSGALDVFGDEAVMLAQSQSIQSTIGSAEGSRLGATAPIIGVASVGAAAASGAGIAGGVKDGKTGKGKPEAEAPEAPVVAAQKSRGTFSGNLNGKYVIAASSLSMAFVGASIASGVHTRKSKGTPDDKFRIGYGTSAVLGGAMQERS